MHNDRLGTTVSTKQTKIQSDFPSSKYGANSAEINIQTKPSFLITSQPPLSYISATYQQHLSHISATYQQHLSHISAISTTSQPHLCHLSITSQPVLIHI
jgi:hypothetical protein